MTENGIGGGQTKYVTQTTSNLHQLNSIFWNLHSPQCVCSFMMSSDHNAIHSCILEPTFSLLLKDRSVAEYHLRHLVLTKLLYFVQSSSHVKQRRHCCCCITTLEIECMRQYIVVFVFSITLVWLYRVHSFNALTIVTFFTSTKSHFSGYTTYALTTIRTRLYCCCCYCCWQRVAWYIYALTLYSYYTIMLWKAGTVF